MVLSLMTMSARVFAALPQPTDSWDTIRANVKGNYSLTIEQGPGAETFGTDGFFNSCIDGNNLRSLSKMTVCLEYGPVHPSEWDRDDSSTCIRSETRYVSEPIQYLAQVCAVYKSSPTVGDGNPPEPVCLRYDTVKYSLPTSPEFSVTQQLASVQTDRSLPDQKFLFNKVYNIPACN